MSLEINQNMDILAAQGATETTSTQAATTEVVSEEKKAIEEAKSDENEQVAADFDENANEFGLDQSSIDAMADGIYASPVGDFIGKVAGAVIAPAALTLSAVSSFNQFLADVGGDLADNIDNAGLKNLVNVLSYPNQLWADWQNDLANFLGAEDAKKVISSVKAAIENIVEDETVTLDDIKNAAKNAIESAISANK